MGRLNRAIRNMANDTQRHANILQLNAARDIDERMLAEAGKLTRAAYLNSRLDVAWAAVHKWAEAVYLPGGMYHAGDWRQINEPVPWGSLHYQAYLLRANERRCLQRYFTREIGTIDNHMAWVGYLPTSRRWFVNYERYPNIEQARKWLQAKRPTLPQWAAWWAEV